MLSKIQKLKKVQPAGILLLMILTLSDFCNAQKPVKVAQERPAYFIALPLRFTQLQNNTTMLSGIGLGTTIRQKFSISLSVYHSFYLNSFKARANIKDFTEQPRLFINCTGIELEYIVFNHKHFNSGLQLLTGWGFMKYNGKQHQFKSRQANYMAIEPAVFTSYQIGATKIGLAVGYRPLTGAKNITYTSAIGNGDIPVNKQFPNGMFALLTIRGYL